MTCITKTNPLDIESIQSLWSQFNSVAHLSPVHDETSYNNMLTFLNSLLETIGEDEEHPLCSLLELVGDLVSHYEQHHFPIQLAEPRDTLRHLMDLRKLKQEDLAELVPQSNLSAILAGKRKISAKLAGKLAAYFDVNASLFIPRGR